MVTPNRISDLIAAEAAGQALSFGFHSDDAVSLAFAEIWDDRSAPQTVVEWIQDLVRRILQNNSRRVRRHRAKQPLGDDLVIDRGLDEKGQFRFAIPDYRENRPDVNASDREFINNLSQQSKNPVESRTFDYLLGRHSAPSSIQQIVAEANCSRGNAYRQVRAFKLTLEQKIKKHSNSCVDIEP